MFKRILLVVLSLVLFVNFSISYEGCNGKEEPVNKRILPVPFHQQIYFNWCGIACLEMWSHYDSFHYWSQEAIARHLCVGINDTQPPLTLLDGVEVATKNPGFLQMTANNPAGKGDAIASTIAGIDDYTPSIMPWGKDSNHVVLVVGYHWNEDPTGRPVAITMWHHDPRGAKEVRTSMSQLQNKFVADNDNDCYWVIVGNGSYIYEGTEGHDAFIMNGGYLYGCARYYNPKGLSVHPSVL